MTNLRNADSFVNVIANTKNACICQTFYVHSRLCFCYVALSILLQPAILSYADAQSKQQQI